MANIGLTDVAYNFGGVGSTTAGPDAVVSAPGRTRRRVILTFPSTTNTGYPAGGVPLQPTFLGGLRGIVAAIKVIAQTVTAGDTNLLWNWNGSTTAPKLAAYQGGAVGTNPFREVPAAQVITQNSIVMTLEVEGG